MLFTEETSKKPTVPDIKKLEALFVDMDDTIVSYRDAVLSGLDAVREAIPDLRNAGLDEMEKDFRELLNQSLPRLFNREISYKEDTKSRMDEVLRRRGKESTEEEILHYDSLFWKGFWKKRRLLYGASDILRLCSDFKVPVVIITNGNPQIQFRTMIRLKLHDYVDMILTPKNAEDMKPSNTLFVRAMRALKVEPERVIMVGDSFNHDVKGAKNSSITPVWFNPFRKEKPEDIATVEITSFVELLDMLRPWGDRI
ncbi:MAG: HAD family hydrolase [Thermoplasmataceae archaeon]